MVWFEALTGIDPDAGSGAFEALLASLVGVAIVAIAAALMARRGSRTAH